MDVRAFASPPASGSAWTSSIKLAHAPSSIGMGSSLWMQDGFPWPQTPPIANGAVQAYDYAPIPGTYWMHSHHGLQEQSLLTAPLIVHDVVELREDRQEVVLMLHDFTFRTPEEVLAGLTGTSVAAAQAIVQAAEDSPGRKGDGHAPEPRMAGMAADAPGMGMAGMDMSGPDGM